MFLSVELLGFIEIVGGPLCIGSHDFLATNSKCNAINSGVDTITG